MKSSQLTLVSHAATEAQRRAAFPGDEPVPEHETARITAMNWKALASAQVWSGPEQRTRQTSQALGLPVTVDVSLQDCDYGHWRGRTIEQLQADDSEGVLTWLRDPSAAPHGGESLEKLVSRVGNWMDKRQAAKRVIAVTHPAVIRAAIVHALQIPVHTFWRIDIAPLTLTDLRFNNRVWTVRSSGCPLRKAEQESEADL
jgi:broad specificity phosphatase PhoE